MLFFYNVFITLTGFLLKGIAPFNEKIRLFVKGRASVFSLLSEKITATDRVIWIHAASLGEFEQGLPILRKLKEERPGRTLLVTFFSPSGYEIKKNSAEADAITYLPLDTKKNAEKFLELVHPELAVFVKYEFWPNYLQGLKKRNIPAFLASGVFRKEQVFFTSYGGFMRRQLQTFEHFFVQEATSETLLNGLGFNNVTVSGDTRFDRVSELPERDTSLAFIEAFVSSSPCMVIGSSWPEDEALFIPFINAYRGAVQVIMVPHLVNETSIARLKNNITASTVLWSERKAGTPGDKKVLILDTIGLLGRIYSYATLAYVGGGMGDKGLHNILEPAAFGIPVIIGENYKKFNEAKEMIVLGGVVPVKNKEEFARAFLRFTEDEAGRHKAGKSNAGYIKEQRGATEKITAFLLRYLPA